ncbi:MAG: chromosomal replication initiator protein DnaA, partial [Candidatus Omnitrophota bacterium]
MVDLTQIWQDAQAQVKERLGTTIFETWILPLKIKRQSQDAILLEAPDTFFRDWVQKNYSAIIEDSLHSLGLAAVRVELEASSETGEAAAKQAPAQPPANLVRSNSANLSLNSRYTFENFVIGPSNRHAHAYSLAVANSLAKTYNPLFIYGGVGLGKTHLIQAICHQVMAKFSANIKIAYLPSEQFTNELINAIQHHSTAAFRQKYRNADVLVIDDVHFFGGKDSTQEEFFNTFNALYDAHKQIILSSDRPPKEIADLQDRLVSRFGWGLTTDIQPPDL